MENIEEFGTLPQVFTLKALGSIAMKWIELGVLLLYGRTNYYVLCEIPAPGDLIVVSVDQG